MDTDFAPISCDTLSQRDRRALIFHLLYAADALDYQSSINAIVENFAHGYGCIIDTDDSIFTAAEGTIEQRQQLDDAILPLLENWKFDRLSVSTRLILRFGMWEFLFTDTPPNIVINEAVELAKCFAEKDAYKFINGILDEWRKRNKPDSELPEIVE